MNASCNGVDLFRSVGIRYDARCHFNVHSEANIDHLNLPYENEQLKSGKTDKLESIVLYINKFSSVHVL